MSQHDRRSKRDNVATNKWNTSKTIEWDNFEREQNKVATWNETHKTIDNLEEILVKESYTITILAWSIWVYTSPPCGACIWASSCCRLSERISTVDLILSLHACILPLDISQAKTVFFGPEFAPSGKAMFRISPICSVNIMLCIILSWWDEKQYGDL